MVPPVLSDGLMIVLVEMLNAGAAPLEVLLPPLLPPPPHAAKTSAPAAPTAASLAELRTFHIRLDRLPWDDLRPPGGSQSRQTVPAARRTVVPSNRTVWLDSRYQKCRKRLSSIRNQGVVFAQ